MPMNKHDIVLSLYRTDFATFNRFAFRELHPQTEFRDNWHITLMADLLARCARGDIKRLIINIPPRYLKSHTASIALPVWILGRHPTTKILSIVGTRDLAYDFNETIDRLIRSTRIRDVFPSLVKPDKPGQIRMHQGGGRATGVMGRSLVGQGADIIILDDPIPPSVAWKDQARQAAISWFDEEVMQRLNDKSNGSIIMVTHRVHPEDLTNHLLGFPDEWHVLSIPAIAMENETWHMPNGEIVRRNKGEALMPSRETRAELRELMLSIRASQFGSQYQQAPFVPQTDNEDRCGAFGHTYEDGSEGIRIGRTPEIEIMLYEVFGEGDKHPARPPQPIESIDKWLKDLQEQQRKLIEQVQQQMAADKTLYPSKQ